VVSINVDPLFGNFVVVDVELREDLMVNWYVVKLEDPYYTEEQEEAVKFDSLTYDDKDMTKEIDALHHQVQLYVFLLYDKVFQMANKDHFSLPFPLQFHQTVKNHITI